MESSDRYKIVTAFDLKTLANAVRSEFKDGWEPQGGPFKGDAEDGYGQAMFRQSIPGKPVDEITRYGNHPDTPGTRFTYAPPAALLATNAIEGETPARGVK